MDQLLNPLSGFAGGVILQERADLHNQRNFAGSEILFRYHGGDQRHCNEEIGLDVVFKNDAFERTDENRDAA